MMISIRLSVSIFINILEGFIYFVCVGGFKLLFVFMIFFFLMCSFKLKNLKSKIIANVF